jgi:hypothetical protein
MTTSEAPVPRSSVLASVADDIDTWKKAVGRSARASQFASTNATISDWCFPAWMDDPTKTASKSPTSRSAGGSAASTAVAS